MMEPEHASGAELVCALLDLAAGVKSPGSQISPITMYRMRLIADRTGMDGYGALEEIRWQQVRMNRAMARMEEAVDQFADTVGRLLGKLPDLPPLKDGR